MTNGLPSGGDPPNPYCKNAVFEIQDCTTHHVLPAFSVKRANSGTVLICNSTTCPSSRFVIFCAVAGEIFNVAAAGYNDSDFTVTEQMLNTTTILCLTPRPPPPPPPRPTCQFGRRVFGDGDPIVEALDRGLEAIWTMGPSEQVIAMTSDGMLDRIGRVVSEDALLLSNATAVAASVAMFVDKTIASWSQSAACGSGLCGPRPPVISSQLVQRLQAVLQGVEEHDSDLAPVIGVLRDIVASSTGRTFGDLLSNVPEFRRE